MPSAVIDKNNQTGEDVSAGVVQLALISSQADLGPRGPAVNMAYFKRRLYSLYRQQALSRCQIKYIYWSNKSDFVTKTEI